MEATEKDAIDLERVVHDPDYRRRVIEQLKALAAQRPAPPAPRPKASRPKSVPPVR